VSSVLPIPAPDLDKSHQRRLYDAVTRHLNTLDDAASYVYLNYGYVANEDRSEVRRARMPLHPQDEHQSAQLVAEVIGDADLNGRDVLDVGCGRGGTIRLIAKYFPAIRSATGVDLSAEAIAFNQRTFAAPRVRFLEGDAENLPIDDASIDVVTNIESACCYPDVVAFYRQVFRVLRPGGRFLYADSFETEALPGRVEALRGIGFTLNDRRDITENIVRSCDQIGSGRLQSTRGEGFQDEDFARNLICVPGSRKYLKYANRVKTYVIFDLTKPAI
jgi:SAM-dependent methyltransferase